MRSVFLTGVFIVSLASLTYGAWLAWAPAGFIVPGAVLLPLVVRAALVPQGGGE